MFQKWERREKVSHRKQGTCAYKEISLPRIDKGRCANIAWHHCEEEGIIIVKGSQWEKFN